MKNICTKIDVTLKKKFISNIVNYRLKLDVFNEFPVVKLM